MSESKAQELWDRIRYRLFGPDGLFATNAEDRAAMEDCRRIIDAASSDKDREIALLKEQIRVADVAYQGLFERSNQPESDAGHAPASANWVSRREHEQEVARLKEQIAELERQLDNNRVASEKDIERIEQMVQQLSQGDKEIEKQKSIAQQNANTAEFLLKQREEKDQRIAELESLLNFIRHPKK